MDTGCTPSGLAYRRVAEYLAIHGLVGDTFFRHQIVQQQTGGIQALGLAGDQAESRCRQAEQPGCIVLQMPIFNLPLATSRYLAVEIRPINGVFCPGAPAASLAGASGRWGVDRSWRKPSPTPRWRSHVWGRMVCRSVHGRRRPAGRHSGARADWNQSR